jgi:hypothetical protein
MTQVLGIGHAATHWGASKKPMHSVHFSGSMASSKFLSEIALFGHSLTHAEQPVQLDSLIMYAIVAFLLKRESGRCFAWLRHPLAMNRLAADRSPVLEQSKATALPNRK